MDLKTLSKQKHIYRIYESADKVMHCEKYPVIYINGKVVYYKDGRKQEYLNYARIYNVCENFGELNKYGSFDKLFWDVDEQNIEKIFKDLKEQRDVLASKWKKDESELKLKRAKLEYERALKEFEDSKK